MEVSMLKSLLVASFLLTSTASFAAPKVDPAYKIASVEVHEVETPDSVLFEAYESADKSVIDEIALAVDGLIALGKKIWPIIDANRPVITTTGLAPAVSIIPEVQVAGTAKAELAKMANWSAPKVVSYRASYKNVYKKEVVGFTYTIFFQHSGTHQGKGKYITSLKVQASEIKAALTFNFDATSELLSVANVGSEEAPVASGIFQVSYKVRGLLNEMRNSQSFYVDGNGNISLLNQ